MLTPCGSMTLTTKITYMADSKNRRTRLAKDLPPDIRGWLHRMARTHAHLCWVISLHGERPNRTGGDSNLGATFQERADARDRTLLYDAAGVASDQLLEIRAEIEAIMDAAPACDFEPGTPAKIAMMRQRSDAGFSIFVELDRQIDVA